MTTISTGISYPVGVRALLPGDAARRRNLEKKIVETLESSGYEEIILPIVDFVDPYIGVVSDRMLKQSYRFTDREGELIAVRSDFTPMVARVLAPLLKADSTPLDIFYRGDVIRYEQTRLGQNREFFQIGAESIGGDLLERDIASLLLISMIVTDCGIRPTITLTDSSLVKALMTDVPDSQRAELLRTLSDKRVSDLIRFEKEIEPAVFSLLRKLIAGELTLEDLSTIESTRDTAKRLETILGRLRGFDGATFDLRLDDVESEASYYSGIRFRVFSDLRKTPIGGGGRYDSLYRHFGADASAVGFTLSLDYLEENR